MLENKPCSAYLSSSSSFWSFAFSFSSNFWFFLFSWMCSMIYFSFLRSKAFLSTIAVSVGSLFNSSSLLSFINFSSFKSMAYPSFLFLVHLAKSPFLKLFTAYNFCFGMSSSGNSYWDPSMMSIKTWRSSTVLDLKVIWDVRSVIPAPISWEH